MLCSVDDRPLARMILDDRDSNGNSLRGLALFSTIAVRTSGDRITAGWIHFPVWRRLYTGAAQDHISLRASIQEAFAKDRSFDRVENLSLVECAKDARTDVNAGDRSP
jgi:hypothetical protein